ncbi:MAG: hypothetical protein KGD63_11980 [Candidatus Lokiarchaeota archaeon]|nr:hypothetical protein [Candidatus Lokiarchaeota archaeon]
MTQFFIITSSEDKASINMRNNFINSDSFQFKDTTYRWEDNIVQRLESFTNSNKKKLDFLEKNEILLGLTDKHLIYLNNIDFGQYEINPDILIFASRHASKTEKPAFLIHTTGIWNQNIEYGGSPRELSFASAIMVKAGYLSINQCVEKYGMIEFSSDIEVSHHGPTNLNKPLVFIELGSKLKEWNNNNAGIVIASAIINSLIKYQSLKEDNTLKIGVGFGGTHYAPQFQRLVLRTNIAISHICPKYYISSLDKELINQMVNKCIENIDYFILDWKGINSEDKKHLIPILEEYDIPIRKVKDFYQ